MTYLEVGMTKQGNLRILRWMRDAPTDEQLTASPLSYTNRTKGDGSMVHYQVYANVGMTITHISTKKVLIKDVEKEFLVLHSNMYSLTVGEITNSRVIGLMRSLAAIEYEPEQLVFIEPYTYTKKGQTEPTSGINLKRGKEWNAEKIAWRTPDNEFNPPKPDESIVKKQGKEERILDYWPVAWYLIDYLRAKLVPTIVAPMPTTHAHTPVTPDTTVHVPISTDDLPF